MSLIVFIFTGLIVGIIAKALVSGRDPGTGIMLLIGTAAQVVSSLLLGFMQPAWSFRRRMWTLNAANIAWGLFVLDLVADRSWWR